MKGLWRICHAIFHWKDQNLLKCDSEMQVQFINLFTQFIYYFSFLGYSLHSSVYCNEEATILRPPSLGTSSFIYVGCWWLITSFSVMNIPMYLHLEITVTISMGRTSYEGHSCYLLGLHHRIITPKRKKYIRRSYFFQAA